MCLSRACTDLEKVCKHHLEAGTRQGAMHDSVPCLHMAFELSANAQKQGQISRPSAHGYKVAGLFICIVL